MTLGRLEVNDLKSIILVLQTFIVNKTLTMTKYLPFQLNISNYCYS